MKYIFNVFFIVLIATVSYSQEFTNEFETELSIEQLRNAPVKLIPYPKEVFWENESVKVEHIYAEGFQKLSKIEVELINQIFGAGNIREKASFYLKFQPLDDLERESYKLRISREGIDIWYSDKSGKFYALQTLNQLVLRDEDMVYAPICTINDHPAHSIRGFMLDVGRNFVSLPVLKEQLDIMASYKMNTFQWHLTDRPAWRIESKLYPELTKAENHRPGRNPGKYYTYEEIRDFIRYARERNITVIPEIDMPGHSDSFTKAMGFRMDSEKGMLALEKILNEFFAEIPVELCPVIHLGSDEVHIKNPKEFLDKMLDVCRKNNRQVVVWNPGLAQDQDLIRQTWRAEKLENKGYREIDSWNSYINNNEPMTSVSKLLFKPIGYKSENDVIGGVLCLWPDVRLANETDFFKQNPLYPSLLSYAWTTWNGDIKASSDRFLTMLPEEGTKAFDYFQAFEEYLIVHRDRYFEGKPFQYSKQSNSQWLLSEPLSAREAGRLEKQIEKGGILNTSSWKRALGNTVIIKDRFKQGGYFPKAKTGSTVFALQTIEVKVDTLITAWIGFETPLRANRTYSGIPLQGKWDANGGRVWVNGSELEAPLWENPGWRPAKRSGWGSPDDQEKPWAAEELYWTRQPVRIQLMKGLNNVVFMIPSTSDYQNWMFTFAPLDSRE